MGNLPSSQMKGAKILIESLKKAEVEYIFGVQGGAAMPIFDELYASRGSNSSQCGMSKELLTLLMAMPEQQVKLVLYWQLPALEQPTW